MCNSKHKSSLIEHVESERNEKECCGNKGTVGRLMVERCSRRGVCVKAKRRWSHSYHPCHYLNTSSIGTKPRSSFGENKQTKETKELVQNLCLT